MEKGGKAKEDGKVREGLFPSSERTCSSAVCSTVDKLCLWIILFTYFIALYMKYEQPTSDSGVSGRFYGPRQQTEP